MPGTQRLGFFSPGGPAVSLPGVQILPPDGAAGSAPVPARRCGWPWAVPELAGRPA